MATIIETDGNSVGGTWDDTHTGLIDNEGLSGTSADVVSKTKCGVSQRGSTRAFFSMKLASPKKILKVQLARRTDGTDWQGKNVRVQVGSSSQYNANDPVCTDINELTGTGLMDYDCDQFHVGQYVILSSDQSILTICEAKVFVETDATGKLLHHGCFPDLSFNILQWMKCNFWSRVLSTQPDMSYAGFVINLGSDSVVPRVPPSQNGGTELEEFYSLVLKKQNNSLKFCKLPKSYMDAHHPKTANIPVAEATTQGSV